MLRQRIDTHIHTRDFSGDAFMSQNELTAYLSTNSDTVLCTTEHYDYDYPDKKNQLVCDIDLYLQHYLQSKALYEAQFDREYPVLFGIEYGYMPHLGAYYNDLSAKYPFDQAILSVHYFNHCDPYFSREIFKEEKKKVFSDYLHCIIHSLENCNGFQTIGHFDYPARYADYPDNKFYYRDFPDQFDRIFALCIQNGKALELNTRTALAFKTKGVSDYMMDPAILRRYKEMGGEMITFGSDAHKIELVLNLYDETVDLIRQAGFHSVVYFKKGEPVFVPV